MTNTISEPTFTGYISSTHDALIIFECVRRGIMPKVSRRLRDDERKLIRSGSVFVFDERESGIKRWTDGLLWSPSRILWNFLVYRQIEKRSGKAAEGPRGSNGPLGTPGELAIDPLAHGVSYVPGTNSGPSSVATSPSGSAFADIRDFGGANSRGRSISSASDSAASWRNTSFADPRYGHQHSQLIGSSLQSMTGGNFSTSVSVPPGSSGGMMDRKEADLERALVGSLKSSYPFAKDGLCKKTISIQVEGSTQHLISYYKVDDVRSGRLRTPVSLPEISGLNISPILLTKSNFRNPPDIEFLPDGSIRYRGDGSEASRRSTGTGSGSDGTSGSEGRSMHGSSYSSAVPLSPSSSDAYFPHMGGGGGSAGFDPRMGPQHGHATGFLPRRLSGTLNRVGRPTSGRYEPYAVPGAYGARADPTSRSGIQNGAVQGGHAVPSSWLGNVSQPHAVSASRQGWHVGSHPHQANDVQQYHALPQGGQWQGKTEDTLPQLSQWPATGSIIRPDGGNSEANLDHRNNDHTRLRDESWAHPQIPSTGQAGSLAGALPSGVSESTGLKSSIPSVLRHQGGEGAEAQTASTSDSFASLPAQYGNDFAANRSFTTLDGSSGYSPAPLAMPSKAQQSGFGHSAHQPPTQSTPQHSLGEYSHTQSQSTWHDPAHAPWQQQQSSRNRESIGGANARSNVLDSSNWSAYSGHGGGGGHQAEGAIEPRNQAYGDSFAPRTGLDAVLLTRPDSTPYRPTSSGSFGVNQ